MSVSIPEGFQGRTPIHTGMIDLWPFNPGIFILADIYPPDKKAQIIFYTPGSLSDPTGRRHLPGKSPGSVFLFTLRSYLAPTIQGMDTSIVNQYYLEHYFDFANAGQFLLAAFLGLAAVLAIILIAAKAGAKQEVRKADLENSRILYRRDSNDAYYGNGNPADHSRPEGSGSYTPSQLRHIRKKQYDLVERFFELCFSATSVLFFLTLYYLIDAHMPAAYAYWIQYQDVFLLVFILLSVFLTAWLDMTFVHLKYLGTEEKADVRLTSSFYIILILLYIRFIYQDTNYNQLILYFLTLAAGRFFYFDFTVKEFARMLKGIWRNLPILGLLAAYSAFVCWFGFHSGFLLTSNGVILSTFIAHLFMDLAIFLIARSHLLHLAIR